MLQPEVWTSQESPMSFKLAYHLAAINMFIVLDELAEEAV
jgi:hypothetical protein